ncbi:MAG TPA: aspartate/glutamate racemase family protein [Candidatus Limnocylindria bacterium]|nr:aspartate/glutamate racemase family protein [Candidatus Limnocylindria bacterium]
MKTVGLIGGMSWESTAAYYRLINEAVKGELGGLHSARILLYSLDFADVEACQSSGDWDRAAAILADAAARLERAGADLLLICTNTMHKVAPQVQEAVSIPLVHIADAAADALLEAGVRTAALLGTKYTMTQDFYKDRLTSRGIGVLVPDAADMDLVNRVIYEELCLGVISEESRAGFRRVIGKLARAGAQGVVLGCTEIGLLVRPEDSPVPVFDTTEIHARKAALLALQ